MEKFLLGEYNSWSEQNRSAIIFNQAFLSLRLTKENSSGKFQLVISKDSWNKYFGPITENKNYKVREPFQKKLKRIKRLFPILKDRFPYTNDELETIRYKNMSEQEKQEDWKNLNNELTTKQALELEIPFGKHLLLFTQQNGVKYWRLIDAIYDNPKAYINKCLTDSFITEVVHIGSNI